MHVSGWSTGGSLPREARGVYWARHTKRGGRPVAYAVDSKGERVRSYVVMNDTDCELAIEALWTYLDLVDPLPAKPELRLLKSAPPRDVPTTARRTIAPIVDPYELGPLPYNRREHF